ncbi:MAG: OmpH family outer membrane protein [Candidatus Acidiferrum sp.]
MRAVGTGEIVKWVAAALGAIALGVCSGGAAAQDPATSGKQAGSKVAAINMRAAIENTAEGKQAAAELETQFMARRKELEDLNKQINDIQQKLNASAGIVSDEEKERLTLEGQRLSRQLERRQNEYQEDLNDAQNEAISRISGKIAQVVQKYAPSNGYAAVLDDSSQTTPVMYASTDITETIVKLYDQAYPVKSAAPADNAKPQAKTPGKPSEK